MKVVKRWRLSEGKACSVTKKEEKVDEVDKDDELWGGLMT